MVKKFIFLLVFTAFSSAINGMECRFKLEKSPLWQQLPQELKSIILSYARWHSLPDEVKLHILSYVAESKNLPELIKNLCNVSMSSKELRNLTRNIIAEFAREYIEKHRGDARREFFNAVKKNKRSLVAALIDGGIDVNAKDTKGSPVLMSAVYPGHKEMVQMLLDKGADVNAKDPSDYTPLILAVEKNHKDIAKMLLDAGADVNVKDFYGQTALYKARFRSKEIVEILKAAGAE